MALRLKWLPRAIRFLAPFRKGAQEASDQYLGKSAKIQTFNDMTMAADLDELAEEDRAGVAALRQKTMGIGGGKGDAGNKDRIVCDDMTINNSSGSLPAMLLMCALGAAAMWFLGNKLNQPPVAQPSPDAPVVVDDTEYEVRFYDKDGNQITVPRYSPPTTKE